MPVSPPPLPPYNESKRYRSNPKNKFTTCITQVSKHILDETECITPNAEPPWRPSEVDLDDRVKIFIPANLAGELVKEEWVNAHMELMAEEEDNNNILFIYSDGSLSEKGGRRSSGYGVVGYCQGKKVFETNRAMGEHTEVFNMEMVGLHRAVTEARNFIENQPPDNRPHKIAFYTDNMGVIQRIFEGSPGKAQAHSRGFRREICNILNADEENMVAISWCPRHQGITGNEAADKLAKLGTKSCPENPNYKTQAYVMSLHKCEMLEAW